MRAVQKEQEEETVAYIMELCAGAGSFAYQDKNYCLFIAIA